MPIGVHTGDSCITKLLSVTHDINKPADCSPLTNMNGKIFDKVLYKALIFKLKNYGVDGNLPQLLEKL